MSIWEIALWIGIPMATLFVIAYGLERVHKALAAYAKRREADATEYVTFVEDFR